MNNQLKEHLSKPQPIETIPAHIKPSIDHKAVELRVQPQSIIQANNSEPADDLWERKQLQLQELQLEDKKLQEAINRNVHDAIERALKQPKADIEILRYTTGALANKIDRIN